MGAPVSAPVFRTVSIRIPPRALTGPRERREGPVRSTSCPSILGLRPELLRAVAEQGYTEPTPVQSQAIPSCWRAATCSPAPRPGPARPLRSCCRCCSTLHETRRPALRRVRALVAHPDPRARAPGGGERPHLRRAICPSRSIAIYGGVGMDAQVRDLRAGAEIVVATPGRLLDHVGPGHPRPSGVEILVLDEADRMLDMGFIHDIRQASWRCCRRDRQSLLFSADLLARHPAARGAAAAQRPRRWTWRPATPRPSWCARSSIRWTRTEARAASHLVRSRTDPPGARLHPHQARRRTGSRSSSCATASTRTAIHGNKSQSQRVRALNGVQGRRRAGPRRDRHRGTRHRHRRSCRTS